VEKFVLIVAGGTGTRVNAGIPKQFLPVNGLPVLMHTIHVFWKYDNNMKIIVALPQNQVAAWTELCTVHHFKIRHEIRTGGETRFHTVKKNITGLPDNAIIAVHDGVRPLVSFSTIERCFHTALELGNAIPCIEIPETLRRIGKELTFTEDRSNFRLVQTPQVFHAAMLKDAYSQEFNPVFTDDASVVESRGYKIHIVEGNAENIKITYEKDLLIASTLLSNLKVDKH
jgi:2-C-methyl-D-erythritol 4-phosphate cytidylyltransferase